MLSDTCDPDMGKLLQAELMFQHSAALNVACLFGKGNNLKENESYTEGAFKRGRIFSISHFHL